MVFQLGPTPAQSQAQTGGLFGATSNTSQQPTASLFGSTPNAATSNAQPQQTSTFGSTATTQVPSSGLFGSTGSLFGNTQGQSQPVQSKPTLSLFGNSTTSAPAPQQSSLFGGSTTAQTNQQQPKPSLFGGSLSTQPTQAPQQPQNSSMFGMSQPLPNLTLGQSQQNQPAQTVPGVKIDLSNIRGTTRFNDLHEDLQKQIEAIDTFIQNQISLKEQCDGFMPAHEARIESIPRDVDFISSKIETSELALHNDARAIESVKTIARGDIEGARVSFRAAENLKLPQQFHHAGVWQGYRPPGSINPSSTRPTDVAEANADGAVDLVTFFSQQTEDLNQTLTTYANHISEIELHLRNVEANAVAQTQRVASTNGRDGFSKNGEDQVRELAAVLREFEGGIMSVANKVWTARNDVQDWMLRRP